MLPFLPTERTPLLSGQVIGLKWVNADATAIESATIANMGLGVLAFGGAPYGAKCVRWNVPGRANYTGKNWIGDLSYDLGSS